MILSLDVRPGLRGGRVLAFLADADAGRTAAIHLDPDGTATADLHPYNGGEARPLLDPANSQAPLLRVSLPTLLAVLSLVLPALAGRERETLEGIRAHPLCPPAHRPSAHDRIAEAASPEAPAFLRQAS